MIHLNMPHFQTRASRTTHFYKHSIIIIIRSSPAAQMLPVMLQMKIILKTLQVYFEPGKLDGRAEQSVIVFTYTKKLGPRFTQLVGSPQ